jgi:uncharacterized protein (DUF983 family)
VSESAITIITLQQYPIRHGTCPTCGCCDMFEYAHTDGPECSGLRNDYEHHDAPVRRATAGRTEGT